MRLAALPSIALLAAAAPGAAQSPLLELDGQHTADRFGQSVASAGDLDGDGLSDVLVGAPQNGTVFPQGGALFAYAGSDGTLLFQAHGEASGDHLGHSVASAGDVDGDGVPDVVAGAPYGDGGGPDTGKVRVLSGRDGSLLLAFDGQTRGGLLGWSVAGAGDVDGDGVPDLAAGAHADGSAGAGAGRVLAFSGASGTLLLDVAGPAAGDLFGFALSRAGDLDNDGLADLLVGAPQGTSPYGAGAGYASILSGAGGGELQHLDHPPAHHLGFSVAGGGDLDRDGLPDAILGAPGSNDTWAFSGSGGAVLYQIMQDGYSVAHAGDVNGDGFGDLVIGQEQGAGDQYCPKTGVVVASGRDASTLFFHEAEYGGDAFGESVAGAGDLDGDGFADVLVGATKKLDTFFGYCIAGPGYANAYAGGYVAPVPPLNALFVIEGAAPKASFACAVAGAGDLDGDGIPDLLVGARTDATVAPNAGKASVHSGADGSVLLEVFGGGAQDYLGWDVDGAGDVDGDGIPDLLIGAPEEWVLGSGPVDGPGYARLISGGTGAVLQEQKGDEKGDNFGASVSGVGDANADGTPDYLVGIPSRDLDYAKWGGARLFSGASGAVLLDVWEDSCCTVLGFEVAGGGDMNADGLADLLLGDHSADLGDLYDAGFLRALGPDGATLHVWEGGGSLDLFGFSFDGAGDVDQDGFADAVAGAIQGYGVDPELGYAPFYGPGYGRVLSGASGAALLEIHGTAGSVDFGLETAGLGDVDGDGVPDLAFGDSIDVARVYSGKDGTLVHAISGPGSFGSLAFGQALASAGDVNADGLNELLVGGTISFYPAAPGALDGSAYLLPVLPAPFGAGCATSLGGAPVIAFVGGVPTVGGQGFAVRLLGAPQHAPAKLIAGLSNDVWHGLDLPLELGFAGFPGCKLLVAPQVLVPCTTDDLGEAQVVFDVPPAPSLAGLELSFQWAIAETALGVLGFTGGLHAPIAP